MSKPCYIASPEDGKEILRILESSSAKGSIELLYTRRPDAYESYMKEPGEAHVFVSKNGERTVGTCAELIREVYIGGEVCRAAYICGFKKDSDYNGGVGFGVRSIRSLCRDGIDFYCCSVIADNSDAQRKFEKCSRLISMKPFAEYRTYILNPKVKVKVPAHTLTFRQAEERDTAELIDFLNKEGKRKDLFPVVRSLGQFHGLSYRNFYLLIKDGRIVAAAALWNQTEYKQYVVKKYRRLMKFARIANPLLSLIGYIRLPREDSPLDFPMLSFFVSEDDSEEYYRVFLNEIKREIGKKYGMFVIGIPKGHFASPIFDRLPSVRFDTKLYEITFPWSDQPNKIINPQSIYPECGLL